MNRRLLAAAIAIPAIAAATIIFHPGVAADVTPMAQAAAPAGLQKSGDFTVDPAHTCVGFDIGHLGLSRVQGRFSKVMGTVHADAAHVANSSVTIRIDPASVDTAVPPRDADLRSANFFDVEKYADMTFTSRSIRKQGSGYRAVGDLAMHGVTRPVEIEFKAYGPIKDPWGNTRIGIVARPLTLKRSDFGMTFDADTVSDDVTVRLSMEATLSR